MADRPQTIAQALTWAVAKLPTSDTPQLDAELLLAHVLERSRTYLFTWPERALSDGDWQCFHQLMTERMAGKPVAYLLGSQGFWSLELKVTDDTLIPRPETELLAETVLAKDLPSNARVVDLGTGTGAIALALAKERSGWSVVATDNSPQALAVAQDNGQRCGLANVRFLQSHWFDSFPADEVFDVVVSNPPYIADDDPHLCQGDVRFEPNQALVAGDAGLADIQQIAEQARSHLKPGGWLLFEHGYNQGQQTQALLKQLGYQQVECIRDLGGRDRVTQGLWPSTAP